MTKRITHTCDVCEVVYEEELQEGPLIIQLTNNGQSKVYYRRQLVDYGEHICGRCILALSRALHATVEGEDAGKHLSDYEAVGPK